MRRHNFQRDAWLVFFAKSIRTLCYGFMGILLPVYLAQAGLNKKELGITFSLTLFASALLTWLSARLARRFGLRRLLIFLHVITVVSATLFLTGKEPWILILGAMIGNLAVGVGETGPFLALEQVLLARAVRSEQLTHSLSIYNLLGYICTALGGAVVGLLSSHSKIFFTVFLISGIVQSLIYVFSKPVMGAPSSPSFSVGSVQPFIRKIAALFALDAFGGGFILQSWIVYWFYARFGLDLASLGWIYFALQIATAVSLLAAAPLSSRWGLVNTMVFSHLVSNLFLMAVPLAPSAFTALVLLLGRHLLSQVDVPTRQAFLLLVVPDAEKEHAASLTTVTRTISQAVSPTLGGWVMQASLSTPFLLAGGIKIVYDLWLYRFARKATVPTAVC